MARYCTRCGKELSETAKFCVGCGASINGTKDCIQQTSSATAPIWSANTNEKTKASPKKKLVISAIAVVLVLATIMSLFVWPGFLKSNRVRVKYGHDIIVPEGAFDVDTKVIIKELGKNDFPCDESLEAVDVISLSTESGQTEFGDDITVRFQLPEDMKSEEYLDYVCGYYNGTEWEYILPEGFTFDKGYVEFGTPHFSTFGLFKKSRININDRNRAVELYAERMAYEKLDMEYQQEAIKPVIVEVLDSMGINNSEAQGIIVQNLLKEGETGDFGSVLVGLQNGDPADVTSGLVSSIAKAVLDAEANDMDKVGTVFGTGTSAVVSALKVFHETGDYGEAYKEFVWAAMDVIPVTKYSKIAIDMNKALINKYNDYSYECLYNDFKGYTSDGSIHNDDWNTICIANRGGYNQLLRIRKEQYQRLNDLSDEEMKAQSEKIEKQLNDELRKELSDRYNFQKNSKPKIDAEKEKISKFLKDVSHTYFDRLNDGYFTEDMDISFRIRYIMSVRNYVIKIAGGDESVFGFDKDVREQAIKFAVREYMDNRKDLSKFFKYMQDNGFIKKGKSQGGTDISSGNGYWKLSRTVENPDCKKEYEGNYYIDTISGAPGSYTVKTVIKDGFDLCQNSGCHDGNCDGEYVSSEYSNSQPNSSYKGGETVTMTLRAKMSACSDLYCAGDGRSYMYAMICPNKPESMFGGSGNIYLTDADGNYNAAASLQDGRDKHHVSNTANTELTVSGVMPTGEKEGDTVYIRVVYAANYSTSAEVAYEYVWTVNK